MKMLRHVPRFPFFTVIKMMTQEISQVTAFRKLFRLNTCLSKTTAENNYFAYIYGVLFYLTLTFPPPAPLFFINTDATFLLFFKV